MGIREGDCTTEEKMYDFVDMLDVYPSKVKSKNNGTQESAGI